MKRFTLTVLLLATAACFLIGGTCNPSDDDDNDDHLDDDAADDDAFDDDSDDDDIADDDECDDDVADDDVVDDDVVDDDAVDDDATDDDIAGEWVIETVEDGVDLRGQVTLALDADDKPHVAYGTYQEDYELVYATREPKGWQHQSPAIFNKGLGASMIITPDGIVHLGVTAYAGSYNSMVIKHITYDGVDWHSLPVFASTGCSLPIIAAGADPELYLFFGENDFQFNVTARLVRNTGGLLWDQIFSVPGDPYAGVGAMDLAVDGLGQPHITITVAGIYVALPFAHGVRIGDVWDFDQIEPLYAGVVNSALVMHPDGATHIVYAFYEGQVKEAIQIGDEWQKREIAAAGSGIYVDAAVGTGDVVHVVTGGTNESVVRYGANYNGSWGFTVIEDGLVKVTDVAIAVDSQGLPHLVYLDRDADVVRYAYFVPADR